MITTSQPLSGLKVLDFTTLLPGPLATLFLVEAGATVVKIERPEGEPGRRNRPALAGESLQFALLNRGKHSLSADLKDPEDRAAVLALAAKADVLVEQFRPGVMDRLGLGWDALKRVNPRLIYCSITGFGQDGPLAQRVGHDLTYLARSGILALTAGADGLPTLPAGQIADVGGGSYPALVNVLMALLARERDGAGRHLDISMTEGVFAWMPRTLAPVIAGERPPKPGRGRHTGGTPRYGIHRSADGVAFAIAPLEQKFWNRFCDILGLDPALRDDAAEPGEVRAAIASRFATRDAADWDAAFDGEDVCVERVRDAAEAFRDSHFVSRDVFSSKVALQDGSTVPALPLPLSRTFRDGRMRSAPPLVPLERQTWSDLLDPG